MPNTVRDRSTVLALLPDNTSGEISAQDLRDWLVSTWGQYGAMAFYGASSTQSLNTTPAVITAFDIDGGSDNVTVNLTNNNFTIGSGGGGVWMVETHMTMSALNSGTKYTFHIAKNGTRISGGSNSIKTTDTNAHINVSISFVTTVSVGDTLSVMGESDAGGGQLITPVHGQFVIRRLY